MAEINLHTNTTQILSHPIVQYDIFRTYGVNQPNYKYNEVRQDKQTFDINNKS